MLNLKFPKDFLWGAAASAPQTEGAYGRSKTTWDYWFEIEPERFHNQVGSEITSNVYRLYKEDIKRMQDINLNSYRTSISWARLLPDGKNINKEAVLFYRDYFKTLKEANIKPIVNLFHFDMPMWLMNKGGWTHSEVSDYFAMYAKVCAENFGDIVSDWVTFNEPIVHVEMSYLWGYHYPAEVDFKKAVLAGYQTILAHSKAIKVMKEVNPNLNIGTILNLTPVYPKSNSKEDTDAAKIAHLLSVKSFLDGMVKGSFDKDLINLLKTHDLIPKVPKEELDLISKYKAAFLGVNYYQPMRVMAKKEKSDRPINTPLDLFDLYIWEERRINEHRGWEIYPEALYDIAMMIKEDYGNMPWFVSENGMGVEYEEKFIKDNIVEDTYRIDFLKEHLEVLHKAIEAGSSCYGYHMWTFVDCWSWLNSYKNRYGFYRVNLEDQSRMIKRSALWFKDFISNMHGEEDL